MFMWFSCWAVFFSGQPWSRWRSGPTIKKYIFLWPVPQCSVQQVETGKPVKFCSSCVGTWFCHLHRILKSDMTLPNLYDREFYSTRHPTNDSIG